MARTRHTAVWTGTEMIVWGGQGRESGDVIDLNTGGHYNPETDTWKETEPTDAPDARYKHTAVWTGEEMIIWGGKYENSSGEDVYLGYQTGYKYRCVPN